MKSENQPILLVEDEENDVFLIKYAFEMAEVSNPIQVVIDGQQAIDYLSGAGQYADRNAFPFPCLLLLDLKLPVRIGYDVLRWIQNQPHLQSLITIVLTSSDDIQDIDESYRLGARSFLVKPVSVDKRLEMARAIKAYWLELNQFSKIREPAAGVSVAPEVHSAKK